MKPLRQADAESRAVSRAVPSGGAVREALDRAVYWAIHGAVSRAVDGAVSRAFYDAVYEAVDGAVREGVTK